jgi:hypothetical protein
VVSSDDDLTAWRDDPLVRALTAPGTDAELAGEAEALGAFRAAVPARSRRRYLGRLGVTGGSALTVAVVFSSGVAAAYTNTLPDPVQRLFNDVLGPIGVPSPDHHTARPSTADHPLGLATASPSPSAVLPVVSSASPHRHGAPAHQHRPQRRQHAKPHASPAATPSPTATPAPVTTPTPTPTPSPTDTPPTPSESITISLSATAVSPGDAVTVFGHLATASGDPITGQDVWLLEATAGQSGVAEVDHGTTGADGSVTLTTPSLAHTVRLRLVTRDKVHSAPITVIVEPTLSVATTPNGATTTIDVAANGGDPGDVIDIVVWRDGGWQPFASSQLDGSGRASFGAPTPTGESDHYRAILPRTAAHGYAATPFAVHPAG